MTSRCSPARATATVRAAVEAARAADLPLFAGGKSFGGRMTSTAHAAEPLVDVRGLVFLGFPLHAAGRPSRDRAVHLDAVGVPMLFCQGTRDALAHVALVRDVCEDLGSLATLHVVDDGDHSFKVPKRAGRSDDDVTADVADAIVAWARPLATE